MAALDGIDRVILLGDMLELRHGPLRAALATGRDFLSELGAALGERGEVVIVPGNHDHHLAHAWLERRARVGAPPPLGLESAVDWRAGEPLATLAGWLAPATVRAAYPGVWLREDVYAMHGHYSARHTTIPMFERLGAGAMVRLVGEPDGGPARAEDYEAILAPLYAWIHAVAQSTGGNVAGSQRASSRAWRALAGRNGGRSLRRRAVVSAFPAVVAGLNRAGLGPLQSDVSMPALSRAGLHATAQVIAALRVSARYVIFGHTHRAGPLPGEEEADWATLSGVRMINAGSWVYDRQFVGEVPNESPYWPGACVVLGDAGPPELRRLLGYRGRADLEPDRGRADLEPDRGRAGLEPQPGALRSRPG
jgi:predicted phosphodiesterase